MGKPWYDVMQVCRNGHLITDRASSSPQHREKYCHECGAETIAACPSCQTPIRGHYHVPGVIAVGWTKPVPSYCHECGKPYPWTEARLQAARELIDLADAPEAEKEALKADLPALTAETPRTQVAVARMSRFLRKAGNEVGAGLRSVLVEIATEAVKKVLFP